MSLYLTNFASLRRAHRCHLEVLAPCLAAAGWDVVLYGKIINTTHG